MQRTELRLSRFARLKSLTNTKAFRPRRRRNSSGPRPRPTGPLLTASTRVATSTTSRRYSSRNVASSRRHTSHVTLNDNKGMSTCLLFFMSRVALYLTFCIFLLLFCSFKFHAQAFSFILLVKVFEIIFVLCGCSALL